MDEFEGALGTDGGVLKAGAVDVLQVNVGLKCNQHCAHCHLDCSPQREETMSRGTMALVIDAARKLGCRLVDITGGAPELNSDFPFLVSRLRTAGIPVQVRTNLTVLLESGMETMAAFLRENEVLLVASMPCYLEENVTAQRGEGVYGKSIEAIGLLNNLGYGEGGLQLNLVYNPAGPFLPGPQEGLEADYKRELGARFGVNFSNLLTITNMPIGRFRAILERSGTRDEYMTLLKRSFNPATVGGLMCRSQLSVGWDGTLYDCDFNLALSLPVDHGAPDHIEKFDAGALCGRRIVTGEHCFGCTAGAGSSCAGALA